MRGMKKQTNRNIHLGRLSPSVKTAFSGFNALKYF